MRILQLCNKSPLPPREGGAIAMYHLALALIQSGHHVDVLAVTTPKFSHDQQMAKNFEGPRSSFEYCFIDTSVKVSGAISAFIMRKPYHVVRFDNDIFRQKLLKKIQLSNYDLVIFETVYMACYLEDVKKHSKAFCLLRSHNIEHQIWKRIASHEKNILKKFYFRHLSKMLKKYERKIAGLFNAIGCISPTEAEYYRALCSSCRANVLPFGLNISDDTSDDYSGGRDFYHIGSMDWLPNIEGIRWLINYVVPVLEREAPQVRIHLAGRNMPEWLEKYSSPSVVIHGEVEDALKFASDKMGLLVPLLSGSGIRIKMIEAMAMGKAVIATSIGAEGINVKHERDILIADDPVEFAGAIIRLFNYPEEAERIGRNGKQLVLGEHTYQAALAALEKLLKNNLKDN